MVSQMRRFFFLSLLIYGLQSVMFANVAFSQEAAEASSEANPEAVFVKSKGELKEFTSDGKPVVFEDLGLQIFPVNGWEVTTGGMMTAIMQEPEVKDVKGKVDYSKPKFRRNVTISTIHKALPLDEQRALELKAKLEKRFAKDPLVKNFQVLEHKFVDHRKKQDALLIYSSMTLDKYDMMQMHVVIGGAEKQFLLTYTDFAKEFNDTNPLFAKAWESMFSTVVTGEAPQRYGKIIAYAPVAGIIVLILLIGMIMQRMSTARYMRQMSDDMSRDEYNGDDNAGDFTTAASGAWDLSSAHASTTAEARSRHDRRETDSVTASSMFSTF